MAADARTSEDAHCDILTVICVLKRGGIYDASWVSKLKACVKRHLSISHRFICLTDMPVTCLHIPLEHNWPGWWSKMEMFRIPGPALYFDLDTAIVGDLNEAALKASYSDKLIVLENFYRPGFIGSGVMGWGPKARVSAIYDEFVKRPSLMTEHEYEGDQRVIFDLAKGDVVKWQNILPGQFVSYKADVRRAIKSTERGNGAIPADARVVCLHGKPKFSDMPPDDPVRQIWERAA